MKPLKDCRLLVTPTSFGKKDPGLFSYLKEQVGEVVYNPTGKSLTKEVRTLIEGVDGYIAGLDIIDREVILAADQLKVIARYGVGVDAVDLQAAKERGIVVTNTPGANAVSVAELVIGMMLALARNLVNAVQATRAGQWPRLDGLTLEGKTVGILGFGAIGKQVAKRLNSFDCTVVAYDPLAPMGPAEYGAQMVSLDSLISKADFLSLHCPLNDKTRGMVDDSFIERMKPGAFLINTARGELVNEGALLRGVQNGRLAGAAVDVFIKEPPGMDNPLLSMPQIIATPHMAAHSDSATITMGWSAVRQCLAVLQGLEPTCRVV
jgi:D-3-phosphoglycerate dehydrogenase